MKKLIFIIFSILVASSCLFILACKKECDDSPTISSFMFNDLTPPVQGTLNNNAKTISVQVPESTDLTSLVPTITLSTACLTVSPASGVAQNFTNEITYEVTNEAGDVANYNVTVENEEPNNTVQINWVETAPMPEEIGWMPAVELNGKVYVIGGFFTNANITNEMFVYDPTTDIWDDTKAPMSIPRNGHTANVVDGKIYVMGGFESASGNAVNHMEAYDPGTDTWETLSTLPQNTGAHASAVVNGKIYIMGGEPKEPPSEDITYDNVFEYDPQSDSWTELTPMPEARCWYTASAANGKVYTFGGVNNATNLITNEIFEYDPTTDTWQEMVSMKMDRMVAGTCNIDNQIFIAAGTPSVFSLGLTVVEVFDPAENIITTGTSTSKPRLAAGVCSFDGKLIVLGGSIVGAPWDVMTDLVEAGEPVWESK